MNRDRVVSFSMGYYILFRSRYTRQLHEYEGAVQLNLYHFLLQAAQLH